MTLTTMDDTLALVALDQDIPGFQSFIGAWLVAEGQGRFVVDTGPAATAGVLEKALQDVGWDRVDAFLLTHIHIDHAGAVGHLARAFGDARVVCHSSGLKHLADPSRLWEGSLKTLGDTARTYGPIEPVDPDRLVAAEEFSHPAVTVIPTPGHAPHHVSYRVGTRLFAGEAGGVFTRLDGDDFVLRPATPPRFIYEVTQASLDRLLETDHDLLCYGHFGATDHTPDRLRDHKSQLALWNDAISAALYPAEDDESNVDRCLERLLAIDPHLSGFDRLTTDQRSRETYFLKNSIRGYIGYLTG